MLILMSYIDWLKVHLSKLRDELPWRTKALTCSTVRCYPTAPACPWLIQIVALLTYLVHSNSNRSRNKFLQLALVPSRRKGTLLQVMLILTLYRRTASLATTSHRATRRLTTVASTQSITRLSASSLTRIRVNQAKVLCLQQVQFKVIIPVEWRSWMTPHHSECRHLNSIVTTSSNRLVIL